jgi:hypothetical protein
VIAPEQETRQDLGWHRGLDGPNLNVPDGKITTLVVTGPGEPARPNEKEERPWVTSTRRWP